MSIIPASSLSRADLRSLGANCMATVDHERQSIHREPALQVGPPPPAVAVKEALPRRRQH